MAENVPISRYFDLLGEQRSCGSVVALKAREKSSGRVIAIHRLDDTASQDATLLESFIDQADTASRLGHPCLVQVYSVAKDSGSGYFVTDWTEGATLRERLLQGRRARGPPTTDARGLSDLPCRFRNPPGLSLAALNHPKCGGDGQRDGREVRRV